MLITKLVTIKWNPKNIKYYEGIKDEYGQQKYFYTKRNDSFIVSIEDVPPKSNIIIQCLCDYCLEEGIETVLTQTFNNYTRRVVNGIIHKDCCRQCRIKKTKESNMIVYGVESVLQLKEVRDKGKETCLERYGFDIPLKNKDIALKMKNTNIQRHGGESTMCNPEVLQKAKDSNLKKYGEEFYMQTEEYKARYKKTCQEKYGVDNMFQAEEIKEKCKKTKIEKYGVDSIMKIPEVCKRTMEKIRLSLFRNGTGISSSQQDYLCDLLNGVLNYPISSISLDIAFPNEMIYIEYDGSGHYLNIKFGDITEEQFKIKEIRRGYLTKSKGWKSIRIISIKDYLPYDNIIIKMITEAKEYLTSNHSWIEYNIDEGIVKCSQYTKEYDFGELRKIKKQSKQLN